MTDNKIAVHGSNIAYTGKVTIKLYHGKKVYKTIKEYNTGKEALFTFLANCLMGNFFDNQRPIYLRAYNAVIDKSGQETGTIDQRREVTTIAVPVRRQSIAASSSTSVTIKNEFLLSAATLTSTPANLLALFSFDNKNEPSAASAEVILDTPISKDSGTSNIKVEWSLIIGEQS